MNFFKNYCWNLDWDWVESTDFWLLLWFIIYLLFSAIWHMAYFSLYLCFFGFIPLLESLPWTLYSVFLTFLISIFSTIVSAQFTLLSTSKTPITYLLDIFVLYSKYPLCSSLNFLSFWSFTFSLNIFFWLIFQLFFLQLYLVCW